ncbi:MAG: hypothetical protein CMQ10_05380 [Gammaproteobacteria bacterium]|nr:hypothetical protein [Gammaproteobacteria bacterium]
MQHSKPNVVGHAYRNQRKRHLQSSAYKHWGIVGFLSHSLSSSLVVCFQRVSWLWPLSPENFSDLFNQWCRLMRSHGVAARLPWGFFFITIASK